MVDGDELLCGRYFGAPDRAVGWVWVYKTFAIGPTVCDRVTVVERAA
jgi:hypothetical protein